MLSDATTITAPQHIQRGFKSREQYLAALNEFAESKSYMEVHDHTVIGWYGSKTAEDYKQRLGLREERRMRKENERRVEDRERRRTLGAVEEVDDGAGGASPDNVGEERSNDLSRVETKKSQKSQKEGRMKRLSRVLMGARRATLA